MTRSLLPAVLVGALLCAACSSEPGAPVAATTTSTDTAITRPTTTIAPPPGDSRTAAVREWEQRARRYFTATADALDQVSRASNAEDEAGLRAGCVRLHDTNSIGLQSELPTPNPRLTAELQRMIDDMNTASHACLRFALARNPVDADNYQVYLGRAVEHLQNAKAILNALTR